MWRRIHKDLVKDGRGGKRIQLGSWIMRQWMLLDVGLPWWRYNVLTMDYQVCILIVLIFIHHHLFSLKTGCFYDLSVLFCCLCGALLLLVITIIIIIISDQFLSWLPHRLFLVIQSLSHSVRNLPQPKKTIRPQPRTQHDGTEILGVGSVQCIPVVSRGG